jgi:hypothetical protein
VRPTPEALASTLGSATTPNNTYQYVNKVAGSITTTVHVQVSADGNTQTIVTTGRDAQGRVIDNLTSWDKQ